MLSGSNRLGESTACDPPSILLLTQALALPAPLLPPRYLETLSHLGPSVAGQGRAEELWVALLLGSASSSC